VPDGTESGLGTDKVTFEGFGHAFAVAGGEQVEQQPSRHGDGEPGFCPGGLAVQPGFPSDGGHERCHPRFDRAVEESFRAGPAEQCVGVQLEEQPFGGPQLRVTEVLPELSGIQEADPQL
jgi:hypothetical protein